MDNGMPAQIVKMVIRFTTLTKDHLAKRDYKLVDHPPLLSRLGPCLFPKAKDNLAGVPNGGETFKARWGRAIRTISSNDFTKSLQQVDLSLGTCNGERG